MIRALHRWPGLIALALVTLLALSGAALSVFPAAERFTAAEAPAEMSVADLAARVQAAYPGVEQIKRAPSGRITAYWFEQDEPGAAVVDPSTGKAIASADPNPVQRWLTTLHRSLFLDDSGRIVMAAGALAMLVLSFSGILLVARRAGGWRRWFAPLKGPLASRLHVEIARIAVAGLILSSSTALWMTASTFDLLPGKPTGLSPPAAVSEKTGLPVAAMEALQQTPVSSLRDLSFPAPDDPTDVFTLKTDAGAGQIDQGTGALLSWQAPGFGERVTETIYMLHTGRGAAALGLILGLLSLGVPAMGVTGVVMWLGARAARPRIAGNAMAAKAETILLVGSEGGSTWGFAATLHAALRKAGQAVHAAPLSAFDAGRYPRARRFIILAATYGNGDAPQSAKGFLEQLRKMKAAPRAPLAVLGFGDSSFPDFCGFARQVQELAAAKGWHQLMEFDTVNRQSPQDFARWGRALGQALGLPLDLVHTPAVPAVTTLELVSRRDYGAEVQAPGAILRFAVPRATLWQRLTGTGFSRFEAGDLIGIVPEGSPVPRFYSLASAARDGFIEIVIRKHVGGLCSGQLMALEEGGRVQAFLRPNPGFHAEAARTPLILIGAGTGVGPLAGFIRANAARRPVSLFFGMRHPESDFYYGQELARWSHEGRVQRIVTAASRSRSPRYVQDALRAEAAEVARLVASGARVMVCGGREMAAGVAEALADILAPSGLTTHGLRAEGRYVEDVY